MIDELVADIAESGWLFNNCYQVDADLWRVNLRRPDGKGDWFTDWATGGTFAEALAECMEKLATAEFTEERPIGYSKEVAKAAQPKVDLLQALGLKKSKFDDRRM